MNKRWKPKVGDTYWFVSELGEVVGTDCAFANDTRSIDHALYSCGNCFRTEEEAEVAARVIKKVLLALHEMAKLKEVESGN